MIKKSLKPKSKKAGGEREEFEVELVQVQIHRTLRDRVTDGLILVAIAVAAQVIIAILL